MHLYMEMPLRKFFMLIGNLPLYDDEVQKYLEGMISGIDIQYFKGLQLHIMNNGLDKLVARFSYLDLPLWHLTILTARFADKAEWVKHVGEVVSELLPLVYEAKVEYLGLEFFKFDPADTIKMYLVMEKYTKELQEEQASKADKYAGWPQLEEAAEQCDEETKVEMTGLVRDMAQAGSFEPAITLSEQEIANLYQFLITYKNKTGRKKGYCVIDGSKISLQQFKDAFRYGFYLGFESFGIDTKLYFFIIHFSKEYIKDTDGYRKIAIKTLGIEDKTLQNYTKDDAFADELLKYLPLLKYNET